MPSCAFLLDFLEKKEDKSKKERGEEEGKEGKVMPFYCKERCVRNLIERDMGGGNIQGGHAFWCYLIGLS